MERPGGSEALRRTVRLAAVVMAIGLLGGIRSRAAGADTFAPQIDDWSGNKLDLTKWHFTVWGDAQLSEHSAEIKDSALHIIASGSDIWGDNDNGVLLWQPA